MNRSEREITERTEIDQIIHGCEVCHLGFAVSDEPYVVPVSYGYDCEYLYIHTAAEGKKIDCIAANPRVCFSMERNIRLVASDSGPCKWTFKYESVIGFGKLEELTDPKDKNIGLSEIVRHYSGNGWTFEPHELVSTRIWRLSIDTITGKRSE
ncbi:MAG: pyridoxamine 5'-phosphate oxidase family protein [Candidatus Zixiibacteriota bacterium]|nr:MAG: pyridoxamine 5'-phosphate oxidase family protein [candidate division Zixibacteria bacterium]